MSVRANSLPRSQPGRVHHLSGVLPVAAVSRARSAAPVSGRPYPSPCLFPFRPFYAPAAEG